MNILDPMSEQKAAARRVLRERRENLDQQSRTAHSAAIQSQLFQLPQITSAGVIFCFISHGAEVSTHDIIGQLLAMGKTVLAPKILPGEPMRAVLFRGWDNLATGVLGIPAPADTVAYPGGVDLVITPGLGFTPIGTRIGYGRGYYDRWFATHEHGLRVGISFECQIETSLPTETSDVSMHILITEQRTIMMRPDS
jgi:5-formyltetrahydrofolate cyclo-ligase